MATEMTLTNFLRELESAPTRKQGQILRLRYRPFAEHAKRALPKTMSREAWLEALRAFETQIV